MSIQMAYMANNSDIFYREFSKHSQFEYEKIDINELSQLNLQTLFHEQGQLEADNELSDVIVSCSKSFPIIEAQGLKISQDQFFNLNFESAKELCEKVTNIWVLNNNLNTIKNLYDLGNCLKENWKSNREKFFNDLWGLIKINTGATSLKIYFHDLVEVEKTEEKRKLSTSCVTGERFAQIAPASESEHSLLEEMTRDLQPKKLQYSFEPSQNNWSASILINHSPVLMMGHITEYGPLQSSIIEGIFNCL